MLPNVAVKYPSEFGSYSKFSRKLDNILKNLQEYSVCYSADDNNFIYDYFKDKNVKLNNVTNSLSNPNITHAIIFGEDKDKSIVTKSLNEKITLRFISIQITRVVNIKDIDRSLVEYDPKYQYIGRGSYWGNPYSMYDFNVEDNSRENVIHQFKYDFDRDLLMKKEKKQVYKLQGKILVCHCKPYACHGDVLADYLNAWDDGK